MTDAPRLFPAQSPAGREFWARAAERRFALPRCAGCGRLRWYLLPTCPRCHATPHEWTDLSGRAALFAWTVVHRAFHPDFAGQIPYVTAFVTPVEDPDVRFVTRIIGAEPARLRPGLPLRVAFTEARGVLMPYFQPDPDPDLDPSPARDPAASRGDSA